MKQRTSSQLLGTSISNRLKQTMASILSSFDERITSPAGEEFKHVLKTKLNDAIRATLYELNEYSIEYRPLRLGMNNSLSMTPQFMASIKRIEFTDIPSIRIYSTSSYLQVLTSVREELGAGVIYETDMGFVLEIASIQDCVNCVLPFMDRYQLYSSVSKEYTKWRKSLVEVYVNGDKNFSS